MNTTLDACDNFNFFQCERANSTFFLYNVLYYNVFHVIERRRKKYKMAQNGWKIAH